MTGTLHLALTLAAFALLLYTAGAPHWQGG
ncbi:hypothetical protein BJ973_004824 [Actinoplanes tereljensis]